MLGKGAALPTCSPKNNTRFSKTVASCPLTTTWPKRMDANPCFPYGQVFEFAILDAEAHDPACAGQAGVLYCKILVVSIAQMSCQSRRRWHNLNCSCATYMLALKLSTSFNSRSS